MSMKSTIRLKRRTGAFTTVEFMGVMVIAMILSVLAFGGFHVFKNEMHVESEAQRLKSAFANARAQAIGNNTYFTLNYDIENQNYWLDETNLFGTAVNRKVTSPVKFNEKVVIDNALINLSPVSPKDEYIKIRFAPDGSSDDCYFYLRLRNANPLNLENIYTLRLYGPTGLSKLYKNQRLLPVLSFAGGGSTN